MTTRISDLRPEGGGGGASGQRTPPGHAGTPGSSSEPAPGAGGGRPFRFFDNREKYLLFVSTCGEKWAIAERVGHELEHLRPRPPALRIFDAGVGDGTVLASVLRQVHERFPTLPVLVVGKEISLEDVRISLAKLPDRFVEHPRLVAVFTNMHYSEAPDLWPGTPEKEERLVWHEEALRGQSSFEFDRQIKELDARLAQWWRVRTSPRTGNPLYVTPSVLVLYREDQRFLLDAVVPRPGRPGGARAPEGSGQGTGDAGPSPNQARPAQEGRPGEAGPGRSYDLVIAAQPYRTRQPAERKVRFVLEPLARKLAPGGRMVAIQSTGQDPGMEIIRRVWPEEDPFRTPGPVLVAALRERLGDSVPGIYYFSQSESNALFRFWLYVTPSELREHVGMSTLLAAWNAAVYVAQIDDGKVARAMASGRYLEVTREVLQRYEGLWFTDECFVVGRELPESGA